MTNNQPAQAEILLLDDVLSALDVHTARWVVDKCFRGDLIRGRTLILITHNVAMVAPLAQYVALISSDGSIVGQGPTGDTLTRNHELLTKLAKENKATEKANNMADEAILKAEGDNPNGKLVTDEEIALGHVSSKASECLSRFSKVQQSNNAAITFQSIFTFQVWEVSRSGHPTCCVCSWRLV